MSKKIETLFNLSKSKIQEIFSYAGEDIDFSNTTLKLHQTTSTLPRRHGLRAVTSFDETKPNVFTINILDRHNDSTEDLVKDFLHELTHIAQRQSIGEDYYVEYRKEYNKHDTDNVFEAQAIGLGFWSEEIMEDYKHLTSNIFKRIFARLFLRGH